MSTKIKPTLIYILSSGRSGSTILDVLLGSSENTWTVGELHLLPFELRNEHLPCGCGKPITSCPVWTEILERDQKKWMDSSAPIDLFRDEKGVGKVLRWNYLFSILFRQPNKKIKILSKQYGVNNLELFNDIFNIARKKKKETEYLIDASKDIYRLLLLRLSDTVNLKVIHLTKTPQGFVYSITKPKNLFKNILRMSFRWAVENYLMYKIGINYFEEHSFYHLKYKDLADNPDHVIKQLSEKLSLSLSDINTKKLRSSTSHAVAGNIARYNNKAFAPDFKWKDKMRSTNKTIIGMITFFTARKLKY